MNQYVGVKAAILLTTSGSRSLLTKTPPIKLAPNIYTLLIPLKASGSFTNEVTKTEKQIMVKKKMSVLRRNSPVVMSKAGLVKNKI